MRDIAEFFKVLADEARIQMLWLLFNHRELCVCDIVEALGITQSKASRHLATLRHAGLVVDRKEAAWSYYSIRPAKNDVQTELLQALRANLARHPSSGRVLRELHVWLDRKDRDATCVPGAVCRSASAPRRPRRARS